MSEQIILLVNMLKERIYQNFKIISENEEVIKNILIQPFVENRSELVSKSYNINRQLRDENRDMVRIQIELVNYLNKIKEVYKNNANDTNVRNISIDDDNTSLNVNKFQEYNFSINDVKNNDDLVFFQTISGELIFESSHPKFDDENFFLRLVNYYKELEYYEMCSFLNKIKGRK
ncbi:MAG: hypothetical protein HXX16_16465 [Bacteroidales bacterium]|nr:hypothetical protein [Bacteroidales bacterium]